MSRARSHWAWGFADAFPDDEARRALASQITFFLGGEPPALLELPSLESVSLAPPRLAVPEAWSAFATNGREARIRCAHGRSYPNLVQGFRGDFSGAPDVVARPRTDAELAQYENASVTLRVHSYGTVEIVAGPAPAQAR